MAFKGGPSLGLRRACLLAVLLFGLVVAANAEKDFEFAGDSMVDDEDFLDDEAESGSGAVPTGVASVGRPRSTVPALYRATINITSEDYTAEIAAAGRDITSLAVTQKLQAALQQLFNRLPGRIRIRIVALEQGSLLVTFDIDTDGQQTSDEIQELIKEALASGALNGFGVSPDGYQFRQIRDLFTCAPLVGRSSSILGNVGNNWANLMVNNAFPCNGFVVAWNYFRAVSFGSAYIGVWRQTSDTDFMLVAKTEVPPAAIGPVTIVLDQPIYVQKGDFIGVLHLRDATGGVIAKAVADDNEVPESELFQNYYISLFDEDIETGVPFNINSYVYSENSATFAIQAEMSYDNLPAVTTPPPVVCDDTEWTCANGDCIELRYYCDGQYDCYDGSDEENCPTINCNPNEFRCANNLQCIPQQFYCNFVSDCDDNSDEVDCERVGGGCGPDEFRCFDGSCIDIQLKCDSRADCPGGFDEFDCRSVPCKADEFRCERGHCIPKQRHCDGYVDCPDTSDELDCLFGPPGPVRVVSPRDSAYPTAYTITWSRPEAGSQPITEYLIRYRLVGVRDERTPDGDYIYDRSLGEFNEVTVAPDSDRYTLTGLLGGQYYEVSISAINVQGQSQPEPFIFRSGAVAGCNPDEFMCTDGKCISKDRLCNAFPDCDDGSDESDLNCKIDTCTEGQIACPQPDGSSTCIDASVGCDLVCPDTQFQCLDDSKCINFESLCDGLVDCKDASDESNCECAVDEFRCDDGECIPALLKCDGRRNCEDGSDELISNCPRSCPSGQFMCSNTAGLECIDIQFRCDQVEDCSDGSDEEGCGCRADQFTCADGNCVQGNMRCDGIPQCEDSSDEEGCGCRDDQFTCTDGNCVEGRMRCDGIPQCEDSSDEEGCGCRDDQFTCTDGNCVEGRMRCDGVPQCEDSSDEEGCGCRDDQFTCSDGNCVEGNMRCDRIPQCEDGSDELGCPCPDDKYQCLDGNCVEADMRCDGIPQCEDQSDELNCPTQPPVCPESDFQCLSTGRLECIDKRLVCDGYNDCLDGSDETDCVFQCQPDEYRCVSVEQCIAAAFQCNGIIDCSDRSDELGCNCTGRQFRCGDGFCIDLARRCDRRVDCNDQSDELACPCPDGEFQCQNGDCIPESRFCDGRYDCEDGTDEDNCPTKSCSDREFQCGSSECIDARRRCDGRRDCRDSSDEVNCPSRRRCPEEYFQCGTGHCLGMSRYCDGRSDCPDGSDERDCPLRCEDGEFVCEPDNTCLPESAKCNRAYDCSDGSDEFNCPLTCADGEFQCRGDRSCISFTGRCNGLKECSDGSDEMGCPTLPPISVSVSPSTLRIREGVEAYLVCTGEGLPQDATLVWNRAGKPLPAQSSVEDGALRIPVAKAMDSGLYICSVSGVPGNYEANARLEVVAIGPTEEPPTGPCTRDEAVCQNGQCIRREYRCDGEKDCADGSDEPEECYNNICEPNEFRCPSGQCVMKIWRCDGEDDCSDGYDESNCETRDPDAPCSMEEFQCVSGEQCIPLAYQCDKEIDCLDRSDEIGCSAPIITVPPIDEIEVEIGGTFTIICEAVGVPTPLIVWRLNWGNIPTGDRVRVVSEDGRGVLTISDARYEDAGAYTCEAINNRGSIFAIPDALVIVRQKEILIGGGKSLQITATTTEIIKIGGSSDVEINHQQEFIEIGYPGNCKQDISLKFIGSTLYTECGLMRQTVDIEYIGAAPVDFEVVRREILIRSRADVAPDPESDRIIVYIGGVPVNIKHSVEAIEIIKEVKAKQTVAERNRILLVGGGQGVENVQRRQIIIVGVQRKCPATLQLIQNGGKYVVHCFNNVSANVNYSGLITKAKKNQTDVVIEGAGSQINNQRQVTRQIIEIAGAAREITPLKDKVLLAGGDGGVEKQKLQLEFVIQSQAPEERSIRNEQMIVFGEGMAAEDIVGEILLVEGTVDVQVHDEQKQVEIGTGDKCDAKLQVTLIGSSLQCVCRNRTVIMKYIGSGPTDVEITQKEEVILEGSAGPSRNIQEDKVVVYMGGIPPELKRETKTIVIQGLTGAVPDRQMERKRVMELGGGEEINRRQRQIIMVGLSRTCNETLESVQEGSSSIVQCVRKSDQMIEMGGVARRQESPIERKVIIEGHSPGQEERREELKEIMIQGGTNLKNGGDKRKNIVFEGHSPEQGGKRHELEEIVIEGGTNMSNKKEKSKEKIVEGHSSDFVQSHEDVVVFGEGGASEAITGKILLVEGAVKVEVENEQNMIEIGMGAKCERQLQVTLVGSILHCVCRNRTVIMKYIGSGPTDVEITQKEEVILEGSAGPSRNIQEDKVVVYMGGIPPELKRERETIVIQGLTGAVPDRQTERRRVMELGGGEEINRRQRQIIMVGLSRTCNETLESVQREGGSVVRCVRKSGQTLLEGGPTQKEEMAVEREIIIEGHLPAREEKMENVKETLIQGQTKPDHREEKLSEIIVEGQSPDLSPSEEKHILLQGHTESDQTENNSEVIEKILLVGNYEDIYLHNETKAVDIEFQEEKVCDGSFEVSSEGAEIKISCGGNKKVIDLTYIGKSNADIEITRTVEVVSGGKGGMDDDSIKNTVVVYIGGFRELGMSRQIVEVIRGVGPQMTSSVKKVIGFGGVGKIDYRTRNIVEIGVGMKCEGQLVQFIENGQMVIGCQKMMEVEITGGNFLQTWNVSKNREIEIIGEMSQSRPSMGSVVDVFGETPQEIDKKSTIVEILGLSGDKPKPKNNFTLIIGGPNIEEPSTESPTTTSPTTMRTTRTGTTPAITTTTSTATTSTTRRPTTTRRPSTTRRPTTMHTTPVPKEIERVFLIGHAQYVTVNKTEPVVEAGFKDKCRGSFRLHSQNGNLSIQCQDSQERIEIKYISTKGTDIEVRKRTRVEDVSSKDQNHDKVRIYLAGFQEQIQESEESVEVGVIESVVYAETEVVWRGHTIDIVGSVDEEEGDSKRQIVEVGITHGCGSDISTVHTDDRGVVVQCRRRADILPEEAYDNADDLGARLVVETEVTHQVDTISLGGHRTDIGKITDTDVADGQKSSTDETTESSGATTEVVKSRKKFDIVYSEGDQLEEDSTGKFTHEVTQSLRTDIKQDEDNGPRRGDLAVSEYSKDNVNCGTKDVGSAGGPRTNEGPLGHVNSESITLDMATKDRVAVSVGDKCEGTVEVLRIGEKLKFRCNHDGKSFEINLVGLEEMVRSTGNQNLVGHTDHVGIVVDDTNKIEGGNKRNDSLEVERINLASHKTIIDPPGSPFTDGAVLIPSMDTEIPIEVLDTAAIETPRRGDLSIDDYQSDIYSEHKDIQADGRLDERHILYKYGYRPFKAFHIVGKNYKPERKYNWYLFPMGRIVRIEDYRGNDRHAFLSSVGPGFEDGSSKRTEQKSSLSSHASTQPTRSKVQVLKSSQDTMRLDASGSFGGQVPVINADIFQPTAEKQDVFKTTLSSAGYRSAVSGKPVVRSLSSEGIAANEVVGKYDHLSSGFLRSSYTFGKDYTDRKKGSEKSVLSRVRRSVQNPHQEQRKLSTFKENSRRNTDVGQEFRILLPEELVWKIDEKIHNVNTNTRQEHKMKIDNEGLNPKDQGRTASSRRNLPHSYRPPNSYLKKSPPFASDLHRSYESKPLVQSTSGFTSSRQMYPRPTSSFEHVSSSSLFRKKDSGIGSDGVTAERQRGYESRKVADHRPIDLGYFPSKRYAYIGGSKERTSSGNIGAGYGNVGTVNYGISHFTPVILGGRKDGNGIYRKGGSKGNIRISSIGNTGTKSFITGIKGDVAYTRVSDRGNILGNSGSRTSNFGGRSGIDGTGDRQGGSRMVTLEKKFSSRQTNHRVDTNIVSGSWGCSCHGNDISVQRRYKYSRKKSGGIALPTGWRNNGDEKHHRSEGLTLTPEGQSQGHIVNGVHWSPDCCPQRGSLPNERIPKRQRGPCNPPFFNFGASTIDDCVRCFCFGQSVQCFSSDLQVSRIALAGTMQFIRRDDDIFTGVDQSNVDFRASTREYQVLDMTRSLPQGSYYWSLPREFLGDRLTSYGGELKYTIYYEVEGRTRFTTSDPDVVISGNGITLYYRGRTLPAPDIPTSISVPLIETAWEKTDGPRRGDTPISQYATREDLMMVLENVTSIVIRGSYDQRQTTSRIGGIFMTTAVDYPTEYGQAVLVEECTCPTGYTGLSCQDCAPGFTRIQSGPYLGQCVTCNCNGHSNDCDRITGQCMNCRHNTYGRNCQLCADGFYGDARRGTQNDCQACPCPLTVPSNQFSRTCYEDTDGDVTCANCPEGYVGRRCERCAEGFVGDPLTPGSTCRRTQVEDFCDPRGSLSARPNPLTRQCSCKENVVGTRCDSCKERSFYLSDDYALGCVACFCMGVSRTCQSTSWNRVQVGLLFSSDQSGVQITNAMGNAVEDQRFLVSNRELYYRSMDSESDLLYWSLPSRFLGDKVTAYGGSLRFAIRYSSQGGGAVDSREPLVKLSGNDITLIYRTGQDIRPNRQNSFNVVLFEQNWYRSDGEPATREHLLMALADLDNVLIRASFETGQRESGLRDVTMDIAEDRETLQDRAYTVEQCVCPVGYRGLSCEDCDTGYTRSGGGLYLGLCEPCNCNGHSNECDPETGVCRNCQHNTAGDFCEQCAVGTYGDATRGTRNDCAKCPCPLTEAPNQFSPSCILDTDGRVTCTACPAGHTGRRCETCISGYTGNPSRPGDFCRLGPINPCDCDSRGTVPNTQCDSETQQCQCKPYTQGSQCARCREGYFYLDAANPQGCLPCFCSGITNQCTSSSYFRESLRPQFRSDGTHDFVLMNRRMNNVINDGFVIDAGRNQISFTNFRAVQRERESLFFQLPAKFRGDRIMSYGGYLRFTLEFTTGQSDGRIYRDVDLEIISPDQSLRLYHLFEPALQEGTPQTYEILLREDSFRDLRSNSAPTRETFMTLLSNIEGLLIRATYHQNMASITLRDLRMDSAVPSNTGLGGAPMVESCRCPEGYTGLSCQRCAQGYLRVSDGPGGLGRCVRCNCNGHSSACDPDTGRCLECQHNTEGDRCERCIDGFYGDATSGTPGDCRACPCPLTVPSNQFSRTCYLADDGKVTCSRCPTGYTGRNCEECASGFIGNPRQVGDGCRPREEDLRPDVSVSPVRVEEPSGSVVIFGCTVGGQGPFNVVWSRLDGQPLPDSASVSPRYDLTIRDLEREDSGRYVCTATNAYGVTRGVVELTVVFGPSPLQVHIDTTREVVVEGRTARFVCTAVGGSREMPIILSWNKQGALMPAKAIDQNGVLIIPNVQTSDAGSYVCTGSDMFSTDTEVSVLIVEPGEEPAPTVRIEPRYQTVEEGKSVRFVCIATGSPSPTIEWYRGGSRPMNPNAEITADGVFRIPRVTPDDEADYYCKASNEAGTTEIRTILYVTRVDRPQITVIVRQTSVVTVIGDTARLECYVEEDTGRVTLFWSKQDGLPAGSSQENGILTIPRVQPSYAGNYICTGTDLETGRISTAVSRLEVQVVEENEAPRVQVEPERLTIPMGTTGTLRCTATGKPAPTVQWMRSRDELSSNHQVNGNLLRITGATMEDRGIYVCRAENVAGVDQDWAVVEIERRMRPKIDIYPNVTQRISVGGSALFQCRVMDGDPPPTVTWTRVGGEPLTSRMEVMENGVIMFKQATQEEQGSYICTATNDMGTITSTATLIVEGPPTITIQPSKVVYALIGQRVTLECTAAGEPTPMVYWVELNQPRRGDLQPEGELASTLQYEGSAIFDIASVDRSDAGYYKCVANNPGGTTEDTVQLVVRSDETAGVSISGPSTLSVIEGQNIELTCTANALQNAAIRWRRREGPLPPGHSVSNGILRIPQFRQEYAGEYVCSTQVPQGSFQASVFIIVTVSPRLSISPQRVTARAGESIRLRCSVTGSGPYSLDWSRVDAPLSPFATVSSVGSQTILEIPQVTAADAGRYRCSVVGETGTGDGYTIVSVQVPPSVVVSQRDAVVQQGGTIELRCDFTGDPTPTIRWTRESGEMPAQIRIQNGVLTIYGVQPEDEGRYICTAQSPAGTARDYSYVRVRSGPIIDPNGGGTAIDTKIVNVGDRVSMECIVTGTPRPTITWSRDDGPLPSDAILGDGILIIPQAKVEDAGTYSCLAVNEAGSITSKVVLVVRARPLISTPQRTASAALGSSVSLVCDASGYPAPQITWYRKEGEMPRDYTIIDGDLQISQVRPEDAGTYVCSAQNQYGQTDIPVDLKVGALVPHFLQDPKSYIAYPPLNDVYLDFDILLSLKPESTEGMVLYNGQFEDGGGDFVCFGLNEGYPEFRFDVGSGPAIIRGNQTLGLNQWHTVKLTRNRKQGSMVIDDQPPYTGESPGYFTGLDLVQKMYLGSVPDYNTIPRAAGFQEGFVGAISEVQIKGISLNLGAEALEIVGVTEHNECRYSPCLNGGTCINTNTKYGYSCLCQQGYAGSRCEAIGETCYPGACGENGRCYNLEGLMGFRCVCPLGKTGAGCQVGVSILNPFFNRTSFISYPPPDDALFSLSIYVEFKPHSLDDGIILYDGNKLETSGDFLALVQKDGYIEFRFDTGSGPGIVRSRNPVRLNEWTRVTIKRKNREGTLIVNDDEPVTGTAWPGDDSLGTSPGRTVGLNMKLPLYLGGSDPTVTVSSNTGVTKGFIGCIAELQVNDRQIDLINDAIESSNIVDCRERRLCDRQPCRNGAQCEDLPGPDYRCLCSESHTGKNCEVEINICLTNSPCQNGAPCSITNEGYRCDCPLGFDGGNCEYRVELGKSVSMAGDGFVEFTRDLLSHTNTQERQTISFDIRTRQSDGLIFWQGEQGGRPLRGGDYFSIGVKDGYLELSYEMGSGPAIITSRGRVDDGLTHSIVVSRLGREGRLTVDGDEPVRGNSQGFLQVLNAGGNIYVGGVSAIQPMTGGKYSENFRGCIENIVIQGKGPLELPLEAVSGYNVTPCLN